MTHADRLEAIHAYVRRAQIAVLDAAEAIRESQPAATMDRARLRLGDATGELSGAINHLQEAMADEDEKPFCKLCGDGAPGYVEEHVESAKSRGPIPCGECASVLRHGVQMEEGFA